MYGDQWTFAGAGFSLPPQRSWELHAGCQAYNISPVLSKVSKFLFLKELIFINMLKRPPVLSSPFSLTVRPTMLSLFLWAWAGRKLGVWLHTRQPQGPWWPVEFVLHTLTFLHLDFYCLSHTSQLCHYLSFTVIFIYHLWLVPLFGALNFHGKRLNMCNWILLRPFCYDRRRTGWFLKGHCTIRLSWGLTEEWSGRFQLKWHF